MAYSKARLKSVGGRASPCFKPFLMGNLSDTFMPTRTLLYVSVRLSFIKIGWTYVVLSFRMWFCQSSYMYHRKVNFGELAFIFFYFVWQLSFPVNMYIILLWPTLRTWHFLFKVVKKVYVYCNIQCLGNIWHIVTCSFFFSLKSICSMENVECVNLRAE